MSIRLKPEPNPLKPSMQWRWWHKWLGIFLAAPLLLVAVTAILLAHDKAMGLREKPAMAGWLPGYAQENAGLEIRSVQRIGEVDYIATRLGLFERHGDAVRHVAALQHAELRDLAVAGNVLYAAARNGIWSNAGGEWRHLLRAEAWSVNLRADGAILAATRERGPLVSLDGGATWQASLEMVRAVAEQAGVDPAGISWGRLILDLHTGKAIFGKEYEWLWIDLTGAALLFLGLSGLVMWLRVRRQRRSLQSRLRQRAAEPALPVSARE